MSEAGIESRPPPMHLVITGLNAWNILFLLAALLGGLLGGSTALLWIHGLLSAAALAVNAAAAYFEHRELKDMHFILRDMAAAVPPGAERHLPEAPAPGSRSAGPADRRRGKAVLTL